MELCLEIDTACGVTILNRGDFEKIGGKISDLLKPTVNIKSYTDTSIYCLGEINVKVKIGDQISECLIRVVDGIGPSLLGRDLLKKFVLPWKKIFNIQCAELADLIRTYPTLFDNSQIGKIKDVRVKLRVKNDNPVFVKAHPVPYAIREKYKAALHKGYIYF